MDASRCRRCEGDAATRQRAVIHTHTPTAIIDESTHGHGPWPVPLRSSAAVTVHERPTAAEPALGIESASRAVRTAARAAGSGVYLGTGPEGWAWAGPERSTLILGPSRSGKTSSLVIPNVLAAPGAVVSTSTKPDVLEATGSSRAVDGWALLYDPSGTVVAPPGVTRVGWSPVTAAAAWEGALLTADAMVRTARSASAATTPGGDHWSERSCALLAPLPNAAALDGRRMSTVLSWVDRHDGSTALDVLVARIGESAVATEPAGRHPLDRWSGAVGHLVDDVRGTVGLPGPRRLVVDQAHPSSTLARVLFRRQRALHLRTESLTRTAGAIRRGRPVRRT